MRRCEANFHPMFLSERYFEVAKELSSESGLQRDGLKITRRTIGKNPREWHPRVRYTVMNSPNFDQNTKILHYCYGKEGGTESANVEYFTSMSRSSISLVPRPNYRYTNREFSPDIINNMKVIGSEKDGLLVVPIPVWNRYEKLKKEHKEAEEFVGTMTRGFKNLFRMCVGKITGVDKELETPPAAPEKPKGEIMSWEEADATIEKITAYLNAVADILEREQKKA